MLARELSYRMADFALADADLAVPGSRSVIRNLDAYLESKGVRSLFTEIAEMLLMRCPSNPVR